MSDFTNYPTSYDDNGSNNAQEMDSESNITEEARSRIRNAASNVADRVKGAGRYIKETDVRGMATDATDFVRRYPVHSLLVGMGLGYLIGRIRRD